MKVSFATAAVLAFSSPALASDILVMETLTQEMLSSALEFYDEAGHEAALIAFGATEKGRWYTDEFNLHMFGMSADGVVWADGAWPELVGTAFTDMTDFNGKEFGKMIVEETPQDGSFYRMDLFFLNPEQNQISISIGHCARPVAEHVICSWTNAG